MFFKRLCFLIKAFLFRDGTERDSENVELVGPDPGRGSGGEGCGWRRSTARVPNMRLANGRVASYRTASEDYGPGK